MESAPTAMIISAKPEKEKIDQGDLKIELELQYVTIKKLVNRIKGLESVLSSNDDTVFQAIDALTSTVKNLAHNQKVLELKLNDLLQNQTNTDVAVNEISSQLESLIHTFNNNISNISTLINQQPALITGQNAFQPTPTPRGPGRPKKNQSVVTTSLPNGASYSRIQLPMNNINIPKSKRSFINSNQEPLRKESSTIPASTQESISNPPRKRGRPPKNKNKLASAFAEAKLARSDLNTAPSFTPVAEINFITRKQDAEPIASRGRKAGVSASTTTSSKGRRKSTRTRRQKNFYDEASDGSEDFVQDDSFNLSDSEKNDNEVEEEDEEGVVEGVEEGVEERVEEAVEEAVEEEKEGGDEVGEEDGEEGREEDGEEGGEEGGEEADDEELNDYDDSLYEESMRRPFVGKLSERNDGTKIEDEGVETEIALESSDADNKTRRQIELERRRDPREKMLVSMKYSDRDKTKSFMESNKDLLKAMKEEERKKRMTAVNYEPIYNSSLQQTIRQVHSNSVVIPLPPPPPPLSSSTLTHFPQSSDSNRTVPTDVSTLSFSNSKPRRMGILSMLNSHKPIPSQNLNTDLYQSKPIAEKTARVLDNVLTTNSKRSTDSDFALLTPIKRAKSSSSSISASTMVTSTSTNNNTPNHGTTVAASIPSLVDSGKTSVQVAVRGRPFNTNNGTDNSATLLMASPIELVCKDGYFYHRDDLSTPITTGNYICMKFKNKEEELIKMTMQEDYTDITRQDRINAYFMKPDIDVETEYACEVLSKVILTERYVNSLEYFLMEFRWENRLVSLGLKLRESKRTWQRRKALFALFEFWRDKSREKRGFPNFTIFHGVKEMENYRVFINRSVSWFYNHITLLKMILFDLCDNTDTHWREWMYPKGSLIPLEESEDGTVTKKNINQLVDNVLTLDFLEDGTENLHTKSSAA